MIYLYLQTPTKLLLLKFFQVLSQGGGDRACRGAQTCGEMRIPFRRSQPSAGIVHVGRTNVSEMPFVWAAASPFQTKRIAVLRGKGSLCKSFSVQKHSFVNVLHVKGPMSKDFSVKKLLCVSASVCKSSFVQRLLLCIKASVCKDFSLSKLLCVKTSLWKSFCA